MPHTEVMAMPLWTTLAEVNSNSVVALALALSRVLALHNVTSVRPVPEACQLLLRVRDFVISHWMWCTHFSCSVTDVSFEVQL